MGHLCIGSQVAHSMTSQMMVSGSSVQRPAFGIPADLRYFMAMILSIRWTRSVR